MDFSLLNKDELMGWISFYQDKIARLESRIDYLTEFDPVMQESFCDCELCK